MARFCSVIPAIPSEDDNGSIGRRVRRKIGHLRSYVKFSIARVPTVPGEVNGADVTNGKRGDCRDRAIGIDMAIGKDSIGQIQGTGKLEKSDTWNGKLSLESRMRR